MCVGKLGFDYVIILDMFFLFGFGLKKNTAIYTVEVRFSAGSFFNNT